MRIREEEEEEPELQMSPMIDIIFQLIIFFMCATSFQIVESELKTNLPTVSDDAVVQKFENVVIFINREGRVFVENKEYDSPSSRELPQLTSMLMQLKRFFEQQPVIIQSDKEVPHQRIVDVLNACAAAGINNVSFVE
jgi:biopolymer transport protein ExbD